MWAVWTYTIFSFLCRPSLTATRLIVPRTEYGFMLLLFRGACGFSPVVWEMARCQMRFSQLNNYRAIPVLFNSLCRLALLRRA